MQFHVEKYILFLVNRDFLVIFLSVIIVLLLILFKFRCKWLVEDTFSEEKKSAKNGEFLPVTNFFAGYFFTDDKFLLANILTDIYLQTR